MAIESYDESQGKPIEALEETMVLDDDTSYFLTTLEEVTRKVNLINIAKALSGDDEGDNAEFKFYTTKAIKEKITEIYSEISSVEKLYEQYSKVMEELRTSVDVSLKKVDIAIQKIDPKLQELYNKIVKEFETKFNDLANEDVRLDAKISDVYTELSQADRDIITRFDNKFNELTGMIDQSGDLTDSLYNILNTEITNLRTIVNQHYNELKSQDNALSERISVLEGMASGNTDKFNSFYNKQEIDNLITEIYEKFKVQIISSSTDSSGIANDLNNYIESGMYFITKTAQALSMPSNCVNGILHVINCGNGVVKQIFYRYGTIDKNDHQMFLRTKTYNSNVWSEWARVLTTKDIIIGTSVPSALEDGQIYLQYFL